MITLDASVVIAHLSPHDPRHREATELLGETRAEDLVMHSLNLAEVLVGGVKTGRGQEMLVDLHAIGIRVAERPEDEPMRLATLRVRSGLKLPDCCALDAALHTGSSLATFDEDLAEAARARGLTVVPGPDQAPNPASRSQHGGRR